MGWQLWCWLIYWVILGGLQAYQYYNRYVNSELRLERLEHSFSEARLNALRMQLDPHFLFNALNTISSHVERDPKLTRRMIEHLGDLLRMSLESKDRHPDKLWSLHEMEKTGGEPDVVGRDKKTGEFVFFDCSPQSPSGRVSLCYDREALDSRKEHKPKSSVVEMAAAMGVELLTEEQYQELQNLGEFDTKSSSWVKTPAEMRKLGGALYYDRRYNRVFAGHNGAQSYYGGRGFRASLKV